MAQILDLRQPPSPCHTNYSNYGTIMQGLTGHINQGTRHGSVLISVLK